MLRRSYAKYAYLKSLVLHKDQAIRAANPGAKNVADLGPNVALRAALCAGRAGAPEALLPARDDLPVVDMTACFATEQELTSIAGKVSVVQRVPRF
jgi:hypothetical protein